MTASSSPPGDSNSGSRPDLASHRESTVKIVRSAGWIAAAVPLTVVLIVAYANLFAYSFTQWLKPEYSHGFLVPFFSAYLAWHWKQWAPERIKWPNTWGLAFIAGGIGLFLVAGLSNIAKEWLQGLSFVLNLCGIALLLGGWPTLRWLWPALAFLMFMFPLPYSVERTLGWQLQKVAAIASEFTLQTIGYPTYREGIVLHVQDHALEVEKACSGLSMLLTFVALSVGMALVVQRPWVDRALILVSAVPVAVFANVVRIALTGVLYNESGKELGDRVFHDFAGWMMMPIALLILWGELKLLDWVFVNVSGSSTREDIKENAINPAYLFVPPPPEKGRAPVSQAKPTSLPAPPTDPAKGAQR
ncbi:MAG: exosortase/archaeosortase family protein [Planctomycetia bacterium]|nr:exosortase/archaeosortase family protein [Planctomycetia bacterium]